MRGRTSYGVPTGFLDLPPEATVSPHHGELDLPLGATAREQVRAIVRQEMAAPRWTVEHAAFHPVNPETVMSEKKDQPQQTQPKPGAAPSPPPQPPQAGQQSQHAPGQQPQPGQAQPQGGQAQQQPPPNQGGEGPMSQVDWGKVQHAVATVTEHLPEFPDLVTRLADTFRSRPQPAQAAQSEAGVDHAGTVDAQTEHLVNLLALHLHHKALVRAEAEDRESE
jgi:hypothetical protein